MASYETDEFLEKHETRNKHKDDKNIPYLLRVQKTSYRPRLGLASAIYLTVGVMIYITGDSNLTTYHAWLSGGMYSKFAMLMGFLAMSCGLVGIYSSATLFAKGRYWAYLYTIFMGITIVGSFLAGSACLIYRANTSSISNDLSTNWITQGKNQQGQATLNACQAKYKCCGFKDDTDHAIQPCLRFSPGERLPGCGPTLIKHEQSDLLKIGLLLLLSSLIYIYGMWIAFKMIKKRVWSQEAKMPQLTHGIPDTIYEDGDNL